MSLPHVLLVDDSEAILAYETAALSGRYAISTASNGEEALTKARVLQPALILLDLSMPMMNGEQVLQQLQGDAETRRIPVVIVSSERERGQKCVSSGAAAFVPKPVRAEGLCRLVARILEQTAARERQQRLALLGVEVGPFQIGIPLDCVREVVDQPATVTVPATPSFLREMFELRGEPVAILDMARRLRVLHGAPLADRKLVVTVHRSDLLALCVDRVRDPEEFAPTDVIACDDASETPFKLFGRMLRAVVRTEKGSLAVIQPHALVSSTLLRRLPSVIRAVARENTNLRKEGG